MNSLLFPLWEKGMPFGPKPLAKTKDICNKALT